MVEVLGAIGSLTVVVLLIVMAVLLVAVIAMVTFVTMAAVMLNWRGMRRRLGRGGAGLELKLSGSAVPARRRAELSGGTPRVRRRFRLGARPAERGHPHRVRLRDRRPAERHSKI
ncbi:hypothetical protein E1267_17020 [Nonomuraea longispora]|uniref:Uncharacterized protein n=1 Tax=Nonomuraea longispora TaxID=1848320 RepID=A0A4R4NFE8_9ACTN|nr:hypothetical protein [Nonomuraea longispora]TDC06230.1 hypothetical protein E1267_17020 [Nonomuraea longispora]